MKKYLLLLILAFVLQNAHAQYIHKIKADSVLITNDSCTAELNLENSTKHVKGFLYNKGNGRTEFRKAVKLNDSTFIFGDDTISMRGGYNFMNGITQTGSNVKLGGNITEPVTFTGLIDSPYVIQVKATSQRMASLFNATLTGHGYAITGFTGSGIGVWGNATDLTNGVGVRADGGLYGLLAYSGTGTAVYGSTVQPGKPFNFIQNDIFWGSGLSTVGDFKRLTTGTTAVDGFGLALDFKLASNAAASDRQAGRLAYKWTTAADATRTSAMELYTTNNAVMARKAMLAGNGQWTWDGYPALPVQFDTTAIKPLGIDGSGNVVKMGSWAGSSNTAWSLTGNTGTTPTTNFIGTTDNQDVAIRTNNIERVRVATTGKVGIGITNPQYKLDVRGTTDSTFAMIHLSRDTLDRGGYIGISNSLNPVLLLSSDASPNSYNGGWVAKGTTAAMMSIAAGNNLNPNFGFFLNSGLTPGQVFGPLSIMQMNGGDAYGSMRGVGIGTSISWHRVHVMCADSNVIGAHNSGSLSPTSGAMVRMYNSGTPSAAGQRLGALAWGTGASMTGMRTGARIQAFSESAWTDNASQPTYLNFETSPVNTNAPVERMRITSAGNVGIGTATPAYKLDVNGKLGVRTIDSTATAANVLYQDPATGEIKKAGKQSFAQTATATIASDDETTLVSSGTGSLTIPASAWYAGKSFRISVRGVYSTNSTNPAGVIFKIKLGSTVIAQSDGMFLGSAKVDVPFEIRGDLTCRATGSSGSLFTMAMFESADDKFGKIHHGTSATTVNLSTNQTFDITATLTDGSVGNTISAFIVIFEAIN